MSYMSTRENSILLEWITSSQTFRLASNKLESLLLTMLESKKKDELLVLPNNTEFQKLNIEAILYFNDLENHWLLIIADQISSINARIIHRRAEAIVRFGFMHPNGYQVLFTGPLFSNIEIILPKIISINNPSLTNNYLRNIHTNNNSAKYLYLQSIFKKGNIDNIRKASEEMISLIANSTRTSIIQFDTIKCAYNTGVEIAQIRAMEAITHLLDIQYSCGSKPSDDGILFVETLFSWLNQIFPEAKPLVVKSFFIHSITRETFLSSETQISSLINDLIQTLRSNKTYTKLKALQRLLDSIA